MLKKYANQLINSQIVHQSINTFSNNTPINKDMLKKYTNQLIHAQIVHLSINTCSNTFHQSGTKLL